MADVSHICLTLNRIQQDVKMGYLPLQRTQLLWQFLLFQFPKTVFRSSSLKSLSVHISSAPCMDKLTVTNVCAFLVLIGPKKAIQ